MSRGRRGILHNVKHNKMLYLALAPTIRRNLTRTYRLPLSIRDAHAPLLCAA